MAKKYTEKELEGLTLKGKGKKQGLLKIASEFSIDTNGLNKTPLIKEILASQESAEKEAETANAAPKTEAKAVSDDKGVLSGEIETELPADDSTAHAATGAPGDELTDEDFPKIDEEKTAANRWTEEDKKMKPLVEKGLLPDRINTRAAIQGVAPIEIARQRVAEWNEPVEERVAQLEKADETEK